MKNQDTDRFVWIAEHLKSFRLGCYRGGTIVWIDDKGFEHTTAAEVSDDVDATDVEILRACVDKALTN